MRRMVSCLNRSHVSVGAEGLSPAPSSVCRLLCSPADRRSGLNTPTRRFCVMSAVPGGLALACVLTICRDYLWRAGHLKLGQPPVSVNVKPFFLTHIDVRPCTYDREASAQHHRMSEAVRHFRDQSLT